MQSRNRTVVVDAYARTDPYAPDNPNLRDGPWEYALDQRAFGPRKLLVAFADTGGTVLSMAVTARMKPIDAAFEACLIQCGGGADAAVAYLDEPVTEGPARPALLRRFHRLRARAAGRGITLVDWISCDDDRFRSARLSERTDPADDWWSVSSDHS